MTTENMIDDLRKDLIAKFHEFNGCEGFGLDWINRRNDLWMKYVVSREIYFKTIASATGKAYRPPNPDFEVQMKRFVERTSH